MRALHTFLFLFQPIYTLHLVAVKRNHVEERSCIGPDVHGYPEVRFKQVIIISKADIKSECCTVLLIHGLETGPNIDYKVFPCLVAAIRPIQPNHFVHVMSCQLDLAPLP